MGDVNLFRQHIQAILQKYASYQPARGDFQIEMIIDEPMITMN